MERIRKAFTDDVRKKLKDYFIKEEKVSTVYLFGSYATEYETQNSDIDFGILFNQTVGMMEELRIAGELEMLIDSREVDVVNLNKANVHLQHKIISEGIILFERDEEFTADFVEKMLRNYFDFGITLAKIKNDMIKSIREEYLDGDR